MAPPLIKIIKISQQLLDGLPGKVVQTFMVAQRVNLNDCGDPLTFPLLPQ